MNNNEYLILKSISNNGNIVNLLRIGLTYSQIIALIDSLVEKGYVEFTESRLSLTENGLSEVKTYKKIKKKEAWIKPQKKYYNKPIKKDTIILPRNINMYPKDDSTMIC